MQQLVAHAVGARPNHEAHHVINVQSLFIELLQTGNGGIGIGERLEISEVFHLRIFPHEETFPLLHLSGDVALLCGESRTKRAVVAIDAASATDEAVAVGA